MSALPAPVAAHFEAQAAICESMGSPFTAALCRLTPDRLPRGGPTLSRLAAWPGDPRADALALRLTGGLHAMVLTGRWAAGSDEDWVAGWRADPSGFAERLATAVGAQDDWLSGWLDGPPQTNESARSAVLWPGLLRVARRTGLPLHLVEIGASAGLNLVPDRFRYRHDGVESGRAAHPVVLAPEMRGQGRPDLSGEARIARREGCDIAPLDPRDPAHRLRLTAYLWADQPERRRRLEAAIEAAEGVVVQRAEAADFVRDCLAACREGEAMVLQHSVVWTYLPAATRSAIEAALAEAGAAATARRPLAWLRMEGEGAEPFARLSLTLWQGGPARREELARADFHGRWIEWLARD